MLFITNLLTVVVALLHLLFLILEMFLWDKPLGRKIFRTDATSAAACKTLAANQGLYNGFLAAGLLWGLWLGSAGYELLVFVLICIVVAGVYGALTASRTIFLVQGLPAAITLAFMGFSV